MAVWLCKCDCGNEKLVRATSINKGELVCRICNPLPKKEDFRPDYTGTKVNSFTVIKKVSEKGISSDRHTNWLCKCDDCGTEVIRSSTRIRKGTPTCPICKENNRVKSFKSQSTRSNPEQVAFNICYCSYKKSAKKRGFEFNLSKENFKDISSQDCFYCGDIPSNIMKSPTGGYYVYNGIDRVDNSKGYLIDNVVPCCKNCNFMKHTSSIEDFKDRVKKIYFKLINDNI